jgi:hypothetical protein
VADEATSVRNPRGAGWRIIHQLRKQSVGFCTATPAQNRVTDWFGYTFMAWHVSAIPEVFQWPETVTAAEMIEPNFRPGYESGDNCLLTKFSHLENDLVAELRTLDACGIKWWWQHPVIQAQLSDTGLVITQKTTDILQANQMITLNRGMNTPTILPNGQQVFPQDNIPPMGIVYVTLEYLEDSAYVSEVTTNILSNIVSKSDGIPEVDAVDEATKSEEDVSLSLGLIRGLQFLAQDKHSWDILNTEDKVTRMSAAEFAALDSASPALTGTPRQAAKQSLAGSRGTKLGSDLVSRLVQECSDGGIAYSFALLNTDRDIIPPSERAAAVFWACARSPMITFIVEKCLGEVEKGNRVLVVMNTPYQAQ